MSGPQGNEEKLLSTLGLCARARKLVTGTPMICEALRKGGKAPVLAVVEAADTSANTHERLLSKCTYYRVPHYRITADTAQIEGGEFEIAPDGQPNGIFKERAMGMIQKLILADYMLLPNHLFQGFRSHSRCQR